MGFDASDFLERVRGQDASGLCWSLFFMLGWRLAEASPQRIHEENPACLVGVLVAMEGE